jgi:hypothetical protein
MNAMTPEYLKELADLADPGKLWRTSGLAQDCFTPEQKRQLDTGVALRRQADHVRRLRELLGTGKSLLITPLSLSCADLRVVPMPDDIKKRLAATTGDKQ